jgi:hypothetical protein
VRFSGDRSSRRLFFPARLSPSKTLYALKIRVRFYKALDFWRD